MDLQRGVHVTDPILRLEPTHLSVEPGGRAVATLTVTNPGTIVESYSLDLVSTIAMPWVEVEPSTLPVYPQQNATAVIVFSPPSGPGAPGGSFPIGVRAWSEVEGGGSAVVEGDLDIGAVSGLQAKLTPISSTGRWSGRHTLRVSNWGNAPARLRISPEDPDQALGFLVTPEVVDVPLGGEAVARIKVRTRHPTLRGAPGRLPFTVACDPAEAARTVGPEPVVSTPARPVVDGAFNQRPILTRTVVAATILVLAAAMAGLGYLLTRPDTPGPEEQAQQPDQPTGLKGVALPGVVTLSWDRVAGVGAYKLKMTSPVDGESEIFSSPALDDPARLQSKIKVETEDRYCYQLIAMAEGAADSAPSKRKCVRTTLPEEAPAGPTASPTIVPMAPPPPAEGESDAPSSQPTSSAPSQADPLTSIAVLRVYLVGGGAKDPLALAETDRAELAEQGIETKVLFTGDWTFNRSLGPSYFLYVDGANPAEAKAACDAVVAVAPESATEGCLPFTVTGEATPSAPPP